MMSGGLTALMPIRSGEEEELRQLLEAIGDDIDGHRLSEPGPHVHVDFTGLGPVHFGRLAIMADPDRGADRHRLLFSATFDGDLSSLVEALHRAGSGVEAIFGTCEGYGKSLGGDPLTTYLQQHAVDVGAFYIAFRDETVDSLRAAALRRREQDFLPHKRLGFGERMRRALRGAVRAAVGLLRRLLRALPIPVDLLLLIRRCGFRRVVRAARRVSASLDRLWYARLFNLLTCNGMKPLQHPYSEVEVDGCQPCKPLVPGDEVTSGRAAERREDRVRQNQLTLVTVIEPGKEKDVRAVLGILELYFRRLAPAGSLAGISTIHFARWMMIDGGRRLLFASDYDGSWQAYIDEFAELILSGLDAIWGTALGCPEAGARDVPAFKRFLRCHQVDCQVFYSAYPEETVMNLGDSLTVARSRGT